MSFICRHTTQDCRIKWKVVNSFMLHRHHTHKHLVHLLNLRQGECEQQQQQDGDDNVVGMFVSNVQHLGNAVHHLRLWVSAEHRCYKQSKQLRTRPACQSAAWSEMLWWRQASVGATASDLTLFCQPESHFIHFLFLPGDINQAIQPVRSDGRKTARGRHGLKLPLLLIQSTCFLRQWWWWWWWYFCHK